MGEYYIIVDLEKKEYINPHKLNLGAKWPEICNNGVLDLLGLLLVKKDPANLLAKRYVAVGRWAEDRVVIVGDSHKSKLYEKATNNYKEITKEILAEWNGLVRTQNLTNCNIIKDS